VDWNYERASNRIEKLEQERPRIIVEDVGERLQFPGQRAVRSFSHPARTHARCMRVRRRTVEHVFGTLKDWMGRSHFKTRTLKRVETEMSLHVLAYNMKRAIAVLGTGGLIGAMQG
jgi:hypothetical protein